MKNILLTLLPIIGLFLLVGCEKESATPIAEDENLTLDYRSEKVTVCHFTGSETNPYEIIEVAKESWINAHMKHGDAVDWDGDGYFDRECECGQEIDCDDNDATTYPGAEEICCDGVDNNCDGIFSSIGIIGSATPLGWGEDIDMTDNGDGTYSISIDLTYGFVKFRAEDTWAVNWGNFEWPSGTGYQGGPDIPVVQCGTYDVTFNSTTGEYTFSIDGSFINCFSSIGIIGSATPLGVWDEDIDMTDNGDGTYSISIDLTGGGEVKFRANDSWSINWGSSDWPSGFGYQDGPNIPVGSSGTYNVTFNPTTRYYKFE